MFRSRNIVGSGAETGNMSEQRVCPQRPFAFIPMTHDGAHEPASHPMMRLTVVRGNRPANAKRRLARDE
jgi:hypothetical protein